MNKVANAVLKEMKANSNVTVEDILSNDIGKSDVEVQFYMDSVIALGLLEV